MATMLDASAYRRQSLLARSAWLIRLRFVTAGMLIVLALGARAFGVDVLARVAVMAGIVVLYNLVFLVQERRCREGKTGRGVGEECALRLDVWQITLDLVALSAVLLLTGGAQNPFACFYVFHMIVAGILLSPRQAYGHAALAAALYGLVILAWFLWPSIERPLPGFAPVTVTGAVAQFISVVAAVFISVFLATSIVAELRRRETDLAETARVCDMGQQDLAGANQALGELEAKKSRFMRVAAHQLKAPVATIQSCLKVVLDGLVAGDRDKELDMIRRAFGRAEVMQALVSELVELAGLRDATGVEEQFAPVALDEVVGEIIRAWAASAAEKNVTIVDERNAPEARLLAGRGHLGDVVVNLVSNAVRYTPAGGKVFVRTREEDYGIVYEVEDTGIGIPVAEQAQLFEEFFRASNAKAARRDGTGLGLSIVREIANRYGGRVTFQSEENRGATFTVTFGTSCRLPAGRTPG